MSRVTVRWAPGVAALLLGAVALTGCSSDADEQPDKAADNRRMSAHLDGATGSPTPAADDAIRYVALGDSFVSGPGIGTVTGGACARSAKNFPSLLAKRLKADSFKDASCAGATTAHYTTAQGTNPPQLDALAEDTTLVTLGMMGGNDVGLVQLAGTCVAGNCASLVATEGVIARIESLQPALEASIIQVKKRAPKARILMIGYGTYLPGHSCASLPSVTDEEARRLQSTIDLLSDTIRAAAVAQNVEFVDLRSIRGSQKHTACAPLAKQWIRGLDPAGDGFMFHPSSAGMAAVATKIEAAAAR